MAQRNKTRTPPPEPQAAPQTLRESAQHIWMAGLSAFAKAQAGGNKVFEALMKEGEALQSRTRQAARDQVDDMAEKASGTWDKLEQVFETRVAKALHTLGVPTHEDIEQLSRRVAELTAVVEGLGAAQGAGPGAGKATMKAGTKTRTKASATARPKASSKASLKAKAAAPRPKGAARKSPTRRKAAEAAA